MLPNEVGGGARYSAVFSTVSMLAAMGMGGESPSGEKVVCWLDVQEASIADSAKRMGRARRDVDMFEFATVVVRLS